MTARGKRAGARRRHGASPPSSVGAVGAVAPVPAAPVPVSGRWPTWAVVALLVLPLLVLLGPGLVGDRVLLGIDYSPATAAVERRMLDENSWLTWGPYFRMGAPRGKLLGLSTWLLLVAPPFRFLSINYSLVILLGGVGMWLWTRRLGCSRLAAALGAAGFMYSSGLIGYIYPGHLNKLDCFYWGPWVFWLHERARARGRWWEHGLVGIPLGLMFLSAEPQTAFYTALWLGVLAAAQLLGAARAACWRAGRWLLGAAAGPALAIAVCLVFALQSFSFFLWHMESKALGGVRTESDRWEYATRWSLPPAESLSLLASGYAFGGATQEAYFGRDPRAAQNAYGIPLKLHDDYAGFWIVLLAGVGVWAGRRRGAVRFLAAMASVSLLIAWGRFFPLYGLVYHLPTMGMQRNPWRWVYLVQLALPALAAIGADAWRGAAERGGAEGGARGRRWRGRLLLGLAAGGALALAVGLALWSGAKGAGAPASGLEVAPELYVRRMRHLYLAVWRTGLVAMAGALVLWAAERWGRRGRWGVAGWGCGGLLALTLADLGVNAARFVQHADARAFFRADPVVSWLLADRDPYRVKLIGAGSSAYLNQLNTYWLRYFDIPSVDPPSAERIPILYPAFDEQLRAGAIGAEGYLRMYGVKYLLSERPLSMPGDLLEEVARAGPVLIYRYRRWLPRFTLVPAWEWVAADRHLAAMARPGWDVAERAFVEEPRSGVPRGFEAGAAASSGAAAAGLGVVELERMVATEIELRVRAERPALLVLSQYYDAAWRVRIDSAPVPLLRANHMMQAVPIPAGTHRVSLRHEPSRAGLRVTRAAWVCLLLLLAGMGGAALRRAVAGRPAVGATAGAG